MTQEHALVVGGTRGIGRSLVDFWADAGLSVSVIGRQAPTPASPAGNIRHYAVDITQPDPLQHTLDEIVRSGGKLSRLVLMQRFRGTGDSLTGELETSLIAARNILERLQHQFTANAAIVAVSSVASRFITAEQPLGYHVAKAALEQLVRFYAVALAPQGIRVNAVAPNLIERPAGASGMTAELKRHYESLIPLGRLGTPQDVAHVVDFLCSDRSAFMTGQTLVLDGGLTLQLQHSLAKFQSRRPHSDERDDHSV